MQRYFLSVVRDRTRLIMLRLLCRKSEISSACVYLLWPGLSTNKKDHFYEHSLTLVTSVVPSETFNDLVGQDSEIFNHDGGCGYETRNQEGKRILNFCTATDLTVTNTFFRNRISQVITYHSGGCTTHLNYILVWKVWSNFCCPSWDYFKPATFCYYDESFLSRKLHLLALRDPMWMVSSTWAISWKILSTSYKLGDHPWRLLGLNQVALSNNIKLK